jgi:hypothetical protein
MARRTNQNLVVHEAHGAPKLILSSSVGGL